ncbi:DUF3243 domain-containing protein [Sporolactobacillus spathodeae]|uniref:DUF3243 domain-containing protein n=1 Tax=Sporolactobacillus spathodeae TaxID=1465502 RepID=A0ABS2Q5L6_9BACL|nr:DUF3243 domain-containing protein [Sporolactobacillus spathodeae]MBM7657013.1 hypothetical protein [Sporolactobacillus spathodeae]
MSVLENWERWKSFLGDKVVQAENLGIDEQTITGFAKKIGDYLSKNVDPKTDQERVLSDLWHVANDTERQVLARLMLQLVTSDKKFQTQQ